MSIDGGIILQRCVGQGGLGDYIPASQVDSLTADLIVSTLYLANANWGANQFASQEKLIFRPRAASMADYVRYISSNDGSSGGAVPDRSWADVDKTDEDFYILGGGIHPQWLVDAMNRGTTKVFTENSEPLSLALDAGFQSSLTTFWVESDADGGPACTFSKEATVGSTNVFSGRASGRVVNTQAFGYIRQRFFVHPGQIVNLAALCRVAIGSASLVLWDFTNGVAITPDNGALTYSGAQWGYISGKFTAPAGCNQVEVRLRGETSSSDIYWGGCWVQRATDKRMDLASTWDSENKIPSIAAATFGYQVSGLQNVASAHSLDLMEVPPSSYGFLFERAGAHKGAIQFHDENQLFSKGKALYIQGRRAFSDFTTFTLGLTETTDCDLDLIAAATLVEAFQDKRIADRVTDPDTRLADAWGAFLQAKGEFQQRGPAKRKPIYNYPRASN